MINTWIFERCAPKNSYYGNHSIAGRLTVVRFSLSSTTVQAGGRNSPITNAENLETTSLYVTNISSELYPLNINKWNDIDWDVIEKFETDPIKITLHLMYEFIEYININKPSLLCCNDIWSFRELYDITKILAYKNIKDEIRLTYKNEFTPPPKKRRRNIKFCVGMIIKYFVDIRVPIGKGVIIGWHYRCRSTILHKNLLLAFPSLCGSNLYNIDLCMHDCKISMFEHTDKTQYFQKLPHYLLLMDNNTLCYAGQYAISKCEPTFIDNAEIGRYFTKFEGTHYVPNAKLSKEYPYDAAVLREILANQ
ncbi:uncharacterized protein LOC126855709 [Cataglyphis hispanica]|uniref:uncharacterized protein LOC126855709 n=1 Tax=Cataglyphis hispanica TaxID=1086592 RepID=UPI00217F37AD|nr:uncharacterized protein LOC126855709 [Cataglyphis hispanica]